MSEDAPFMRRALTLARRGYGTTSPNPMVGAVLVRAGRILGRGWHHQAGQPHAEIEALRDAQSHARSVRGATLYVTLEPCCTFGRTPPCTQAILQAGIRKVVVGATDPNPQHRGRAFELLQAAGVKVVPGVLAEECTRLNEAFNHWIVQRSPLVTVKAAMTLDGKIATAAGQSKWITGPQAREFAQHLRRGSDAILAGINTVLLDNPSLTARGIEKGVPPAQHRLRRLVLDALARTPLESKLVSNDPDRLTTIVVGPKASKKRVAALSKKVRVLTAPLAPTPEPHPKHPSLDLEWLLRKLGEENITSLLVEGGGEVNAAFLMAGLAQKIAFFYAPKILGGRDARRGVAGEGARSWEETLELTDLHWDRLGEDLLLQAWVQKRGR